MRIIGLDVGEKRIGVARADSSTRIAVPLGFIEVNGGEWEQIARLARVNGTNLFVLGLPRSNEGKETAQSLYVRNFAKILVQKIPEARIKFQDESLTSVLAEDRLKKRRKSYQKGDIDAEAASIILQDFVENFKIENTLTGEGNTNLTKKEAEKMKIKTKKAKQKVKKTTKWLTSGIIVAVLIIVAAGAVLWYKDYRAKEYARYLAEQEAILENASFDFMIKPGETIFDIQDNLIALGYSEIEVESAFNANYDFDFLKNRPSGATLEGYLYGETHTFYKNTPVTEILEAFLSDMSDVITENDLEVRYQNQGLTLHEGITLASMIQKEAKSAEQATVAQVFLTRLNNGISLGSDVTASYAADVIDPERQIYTTNSEVLTIDSCYNTRLYQGLPCGPISNPGLSALLAVAEPSETSYLYFLTGDDGMMYYSYTEDEHVQNIYSHCQNLCNASLWKNAKKNNS